MNRWWVKRAHPIPNVTCYLLAPAEGLPPDWRDQFVAQLAHHILGFITTSNPAGLINLVFNQEYKFGLDSDRVAAEEIRHLIDDDNALKGLIGESLCYWSRRSSDPPLYIDRPHFSPREPGKDFLEIVVDGGQAFLLVWEAKCTAADVARVSTRAIRYFEAIEKGRRLLELNYRLQQAVERAANLAFAQPVMEDLPTLYRRKRYGIFAAFDERRHAVPSQLRTYPIAVDGDDIRRQAHYVPWPDVDGLVADLRRRILAELP